MNARQRRKERRRRLRAGAAVGQVPRWLWPWDAERIEVIDRVVFDHVSLNADGSLGWGGRVMASHIEYRRPELRSP